MKTVLSKFTVSKNEWITVGEALLYVASAAIVDYLANHLGLLPLSPVVITILTPVLKALKLFLDGKVN